MWPVPGTIETGASLPAAYFSSHFMDALSFQRLNAERACRKATFLKTPSSAIPITQSDPV
jgi:hypothetical protein